MPDSTSRPSARSLALKTLGGLLAFGIASAGVGVLGAALAVPAVSAAGTVADEAVSLFEALPTALEEKELSQQSRMWAADGSLLATFYFRNRIIVDLDEINPVMQDAMVAIEDARFYEHGGVDLQGVARAAVNNFTEDSLQGASTLTQQYVKNVLISQADAEGDMRALNAARERSYGRKLREMKLAIALEQRLSKEEILERYLNIAQFGRSQYGVEAAARYYFNTTAADLTLAEAATLAGVTQSPNALDPERNPEAATGKRDTVLKRMEELGYISKSQMEEATAVPVEEMLDVRPTSQTCVGVGKKGNAAFFCDYVTKYITHNEAFGETREERTDLLYRGGLDIYTTLDPKIQEQAQNAVLDAVPKNDESGVAAAIVTVDPRNGDILAMTQNRDYRTGNDTGVGETAVNYSTDQEFGGSNGFQPGSTYKPFVLAAWLESGKSLNQRVNATVRPYRMDSWNASCVDGRFTGPDWSPRNSDDGQGSGSLPVLDATAGSINTGFVAMAHELDLCEIRDVAERVGFHRADGAEPEVLPSMVLGTQLASPLTMASAYATFAAEGTYCEPRAITRITDANGEEIKIPETSCREVISPEVANAVNYALTQVIERGTGRGYGLHDRPAAGKTGTTNDNVQSWFVGYTPQLSTAVWVGNAEGNIPLQNITINGKWWRGVFGSSIAAPTWQKYMAAITEGMPVEGFHKVQDRQLYGKRVPVPSVLGYDLDSAEEILANAGLQLGAVQEAPSDEWAAGAIIGMSPDANAQVRPGTTINLIVSNGQDTNADDEDEADDDSNDEDDDNARDNDRGRGNRGEHGRDNIGRGNRGNND